MLPTYSMPGNRVRVQELPEYSKSLTTATSSLRKSRTHPLPRTASMRTRGRQVNVSHPGWSVHRTRLVGSRSGLVRLLHFAAAPMADLTVKSQGQSRSRVTGRSSMYALQ